MRTLATGTVEQYQVQE